MQKKERQHRERAGTGMKGRLKLANASLSRIAEIDRLGFLALFTLIREVEKNTTRHLTETRR